MRWRNFRYKRLFAWAALLVLASRGIVPVGYMPDFSGHGLFVICDGTDHISAAHDHHGHDHAGHQHNHHSVCPYSEGAVYGFAGISVPPPAQIPYPSYVILIPAPQPLASSTAFSNVSPRSPPFFS